MSLQEDDKQEKRQIQSCSCDDKVLSAFIDEVILSRIYINTII